MPDPVVAAVVLCIIRVAYSVSLHCVAIFRERTRGRAVEALVRAAEPGSGVLDRRADGSLTAVTPALPRSPRRPPGAGEAKGEPT